MFFSFLNWELLKTVSNGAETFHMNSEKEKYKDHFVNCITFCDYPTAAPYV